MAGPPVLPPAGSARHRITTEEFRDLAYGTGGRDTIATLAAGQRSRSMLLLRALVDLAAGHPALPGRSRRPPRPGGCWSGPNGAGPPR
ncbi:hypothetical protein [Streptomyces pactum]|uniref:hypothetical protein n=1 Tax=Streptomyces pactum TaxID=68249 RepID=UPI0036F8200C